MSDNTNPNTHPLTTGTDLSPTPFVDVVEPFAGVVGTDFLTFGIGGGANVEAQLDYQNDPQRPTGNLPGLARSNFNNKAIRQGTFVAHSLCLWISQQIQVYIPDDGNDIAWIGEFSSALAQFVLALIPPGPNLGAYLPLAGGNMSGNITFSPGITTILSNNTWYYARDTAGTARGLIIKGGDNNIYINDGSCPYVMFNGSPILSNNTWYGARSTTGSLHGIIGILSDNATHVASGPNGNIFLDTNSGGSIWTTSNIVIPNNNWYYSKTTDGVPRYIAGISSGNELQIGSGHSWVTSIFAGGGQYIYMRSTTNVQGQFIANQYSYLNGGGRAYIPGGNDPWQVYADQGHYSRTHYIVGNTRDWSLGCEFNGNFMIADESAAAVRFEFDLNGGAHFYNNLYAADCSFGGVTVTAFHATSWAQVDGGLTVYNGLNIASGNLSVSGREYLYGGLSVWNGIEVNSGNFHVINYAQVDGGMTVFNNFNMASGTMWVNGPLFAYSNIEVSGGLHIGSLSWLVDGGGNWLTSGGNLNFYGWVQGGYVHSTGDGRADGNWSANGLYGNYIQSNANALVNGQLTVNAQLSVGSYTYLYNVTQCWGDFYAYARLLVGGTGGFQDGGSNWINSPANFHPFGAVQVDAWLNVGGGSNIWNGLSVQSGDLNMNGNLYTQGWGIIWGGLRVGTTGPHWDPGIGTYTNGFRSDGPSVLVGDVSFFSGIMAYAGSSQFGDSGHYHQMNITRSLHMQDGSSGAAWRDTGRLNWDSPSDRRFKRDVEPYRVGLGVIRRLEPVSYVPCDLFSGEPFNDDRAVGLMADEAELVMPEMVFDRSVTVDGMLPSGILAKKEIDLKMMNISALHYAMLNAIKELADRLETLENEKKVLQ